MATKEVILKLNKDDKRIGFVTIWVHENKGLQIVYQKHLLEVGERFSPGMDIDDFSVGIEQSIGILIICIRD